MQIFYNIGNYLELLVHCFTKPQKKSVFYKQTIIEIEKLGLNSVGIVFIISFFFGAVISMQTAYNMENPLLPNYLVGLTTRDTVLLEFSSTIMCLILAGKVGSNIASEIGTMRVTEQIDALEIMGINPANYLILPKITASLIIFPFLSIISMIIGIAGGWFSGFITGDVPSAEFIYGIQYAFNSYYIFYSVVKTIFFAFLIITVSGYFGFYTDGGALEVGRSSTKAVVNSSLLILVFNLLITKLML